jgi:phosphoglucomutase
MTTIEKSIMEQVQIWLDGKYDDETKKIIRDHLENNPQEIIDAFYKNLEFGTGGMRGKMGPGINRMNVYTVSMATQGLANYLLKMFPGKNISVAIAYDCRINNTLFSQTAANVLSANGIQVYLFDGMRPTPELSFAIRHLKCQSGIVVTASHNPKNYNGYKVYWEDGAQLVSPHDQNVIQEVLSIKGIDEVKSEPNNDLIQKIGKEVDEAFLKQVAAQALNPEVEGKEKVKVVFTPLHGTGGVLTPQFLKDSGYVNTLLVEEQMIPDGNFPTAKSPNPEEPAALEMALEKAKKADADIVMANDPDADRIGIAVKDHSGNYVLLNGNQTGAIIVKYMLEQWKRQNRFKGNEITVKTIVTSELLKDISESYQVKQYDVLTGFKWIADIIRRQEDKEQFIVGLEESFGYMIGDFVRDKDSVSSALLICEMAAYYAKENKSLFDKLIDVYLEYGFYKEGLVNIVKEGKKGSEEIEAMMENFRKHAPVELASSKVEVIKDYQSSLEKNVKTGEEKSIHIPKSNVLQYITEDGTKISVRPSGTEPKIKFYVSVKEELKEREDYHRVHALLDRKIKNVLADLHIG